MKPWINNAKLRYHVKIIPRSVIQNDYNFQLIYCRRAFESRALLTVLGDVSNVAKSLSCKRRFDQIALIKS